jgi:uncharacterized protein (TIGR02588 family)
MKVANRDNRADEKRAKQRLEAIAGVIGAGLALGTLGVIVWDGARGGGGPAAVTVETLAVHAHEGGFVLEVEVFNSGDEAAAGVVVAGELRREDTSIAESETTFDYVASGSRRRGGLFFLEDPREYQVNVRALGYVVP